MLKRGGKREAKLATALSPLAAFFAYRHPSVAAEQKPASLEAADKAQRKVQARIDKLQAELLALQTAKPTPDPPAHAGASDPPAPATNAGSSPAGEPPHTS
jgi:hypothetical protein